MTKARGQGSTEYLILLAVVLIVALVSVALLGFFPGITNDAKMAQLDAYWKGTYPIAIAQIGQGYTVNGSAGFSTISGMRLKNVGGTPIKINTITGGESGGWSTANGGPYPGPGLSYYYNAPYLIEFDNTTIHPGEEFCIGHVDDPCSRYVSFQPDGTGADMSGGADIAKQLCELDGSGYIVIDKFGFQYAEIIDGIEIARTFRGTKPLMAKCIGKTDYG